MYTLIWTRGGACTLAIVDKHKNDIELMKTVICVYNITVVAHFLQAAVGHYLGVGSWVNITRTVIQTIALLDDGGNGDILVRLLFVTFSTLWANSTDEKNVVVSLFFPENRFWHFMQIVSTRSNLLEMSKPVL